MSSVPSDPYLAKFPRPVKDNGWGLHFSLDQRMSSVIPDSEWMHKMQMSWSTIYGDDENTTGRAAEYLYKEYGIISQIRIQATGDMPKPPSSWAGYTRHIRSLGLPAYMKIFNEPGDGRENWDSYEQFSAKWNERAGVVVAEGGYPGLQVLDEEALAIAVAGMSPEVADNFYFSLHNYGANHPPQYPYNIGKTALEDDTCVLRFLAFAEWFKKHLGKVPPMLGSEGGWLYGNHDDASYPAIEGQEWRDWNKEMFSWFKSGVISNNTPLPNYLFCVSPWLLYASNWASDSWINGNNEAEIAPLRDYFENEPPFVRQFGATTNPIPPTEPPPDPPPHVPHQTLEERVKQVSSTYPWMPVNNTAALWQAAQAMELQDQQTDEFAFTYDGTDYIAQVFNLGIVYCKTGDYANVSVMRK